MDRARRLRKGREFDTAYKEGAVAAGPLLVVRARANGGTHSRWGFAVGKRLDRRAVVRNRAKRRLLAAAALAEIPAGFDFVVTARAVALRATFAALGEALAHGVKQAVSRIGAGESGVRR